MKVSDADILFLKQDLILWTFRQLELGFTRESILAALNYTVLRIARERDIEIGMGKTEEFFEQMRPVIISLRSIVNCN